MISIIKFSVQFFLSENYNLDSVTIIVKVSVANVEDAHHSTQLMSQSTLRTILGTKVCYFSKLIIYFRLRTFMRS